MLPLTIPKSVDDNTLKAQSQRDYIFQFLRAIACLTVIFGHLFYPEELKLKLIEHYYFWPAQIGVGIFFFISGYLILLSLERLQSTKGFLILRFFRIFPVYWICSIVSICIFFFLNYSYSGKFEFKDIISQIFFLNDFSNSKYLLAGQWTVFIEVKFYILAALSYVLSKGKWKKFCLYYLVGLALFTASGFLLFVKYPHYLYRVTSQTFLGLTFIFCGTLFYFFKNGLLNKQNLYFFTTILCVSGCIGFTLMNPNHKHAFVMTLSYVSGVILSLFCISIQDKIKYSKIIDFFANISYPLYLIHLTVGLMGLSGVLCRANILQRSFCNCCMKEDFLDRALLLILFTIPTSFLIHKIIELPAIRFSKNFVKRIHK